MWKAILLSLTGILFLRLTGRKSISQTTIATTVVMISIGTILVQPILETSLWKTVVSIFLISAMLMLLEYLQLKFDFFETFISGKSKVVIQDGQLDVKNLKKMRITVDQLEGRLRQAGINKISDVKTATLESNGQLGYELMPDAKPLTVGEFKKLVGYLVNQEQTTSSQTFGLFDEVKEKQHNHHVPDKLQ